MTHTEANKVARELCKIKGLSAASVAYVYGRGGYVVHATLAIGEDIILLDAEAAARLARGWGQILEDATGGGETWQE